VADPWLPWPPEADHLNVAVERADPSSMLHLYRRVLTVRRSSPALRTGDLVLLDDLPDGVLGYERLADDGDRRIVLINFTDGEVEVGTDAGRAGTIDISTDGSVDGAPFTGTLAADQAVVIRP
jgi:alpha-glucosidase